jgi:hypothetical protein
MKQGKTLVAGWFSFEEMGATAGDILTRDLVCEWLEGAGRSYDIANAAPFQGGVDWQQVDPCDYDDVVFVCGPFGNGEPVTTFLARFPKARLIGMNLSVLDPLSTWDPFHALFERDSDRTDRPDMSFLTNIPHVPVVGLIQVHPQNEYGKRSRHEAANGLIEQLVGAREMATVKIDTRLDINEGGLRTAREVESLIARMDAVITTRLHGLVLAIKNGVPAVAIDPIAGGAKVKRQADVIGWPLVFTTDELTLGTLEQALDQAVQLAAREAARRSAAQAAAILAPLQDQFIAALNATD